jgi:hypothetical protein
MQDEKNKNKKEVDKDEVIEELFGGEEKIEATEKEEEYMFPENETGASEEEISFKQKLEEDRKRKKEAGQKSKQKKLYIEKAKQKKALFNFWKNKNEDKKLISEKDTKELPEVKKIEETGEEMLLPEIEKLEDKKQGRLENKIKKIEAHIETKEEKKKRQEKIRKERKAKKEVKKKEKQEILNKKKSAKKKEKQILEKHEKLSQEKREEAFLKQKDLEKEIENKTSELQAKEQEEKIKAEEARKQEMEESIKQRAEEKEYKKAIKEKQKEIKKTKQQKPSLGWYIQKTRKSVLCLVGIEYIIYLLSLINFVSVFLLEIALPLLIIVDVIVYITLARRIKKQEDKQMLVVIKAMILTGIVVGLFRAVFKVFWIGEGWTVVNVIIEPVISGGVALIATIFSVGINKK